MITKVLTEKVSSKINKLSYEWKGSQVVNTLMFFNQWLFDICVSLKRTFDVRDLDLQPYTGPWTRMSETIA